MQTKTKNPANAPILAQKWHLRLFARVFGQIRALYLRSDRLVSLLVGMRSYDKYVEHMRQKHPERKILSRREFFKEALEARYSGGVNRCC